MASTSFLDLSRFQFATTAAFHMTFPALSVGLAIFLVICYACYCKTDNPIYLQMFRFWRKIFAVGFALGIVAGIVLTFELGLNWGGYSRAVGPVLGPIICLEALTAFFLEAGFIGILLYGEGRVSRKVTLVAACLVALGALLSTAWILAANSWMQTPTGYTEINGQFQPTSWYHVIFNPAFVWRFPHQVLAVLISAAWFIAAIGAYYLLKNRAAEFARKTMSIGLLGASLLLPIQLYVGDSTASYVSAVYQPAKVTAAEGNFANGNTGWNLIVIPNQSKQKDDYTLSIPHAGSVFVFHNFSGTTPVPGLSLFPKSMQPPVWPTFYGFKVMIFAAWGMFSVAFIGLVMRLRRRMFTERWFLRLVLWTMPVGVFATIAGWVVSESGRQPWLVNGKLLVSNSPSSLSTGELIATLVGFWVVYLVLFGAWVRHVVREVRRGPEELPTTSADTPPASPPRPSTQLAPVLVPLGSE
ncbi:MAG: cytochrome bd ubiquinol oxidase subunit [Pseudonocardiales bacterium]|jgi:cytochrome d ubiquinol oxidase subunit I|nr:cytochrome bd ubiquinol oxidase subunit [Pseudonocardiales bacterium]